MTQYLLGGSYRHVALITLSRLACVATLLLSGTNTAWTFSPYMILFDHGSAEINAEGQAVLDAVLSDLQMLGSSPVTLVGHADRLGLRADNMRLSQLRAEAVRDALVEGGVPAASIRIVAVGEEEPARPTADGVRDILDRRVDITLQAATWTDVPPTIEKGGKRPEILPMAE